MIVHPLSVLLSFIIAGLVCTQMEYRNAEGERGTCVELNNCPTMYSLFNSEPLSLLTIEFLRRSKCEFDERNQLLCCVNPATDTFAGDNSTFDLKTHPKASLLPLDSCGLDKKRIWTGSDVKLDEFPWMALLYRHNEVHSFLNFACGGALINKRYVLTVAHCALREIVTVRLGEYDLHSDQDCETDIFSGRLQCAPPPQDFGIEEVIQHPEYGQREINSHDIALIRLDRDVKLDTQYVKPICLPTVADVEIGKELPVAGWGSTKTGEGSQVKLKVEIPVMSTEECKRIWAKFDISIGEGQLCAGGVLGKQACSGDSGMPLIDWTESLDDGSRRYSVVGLVSFGFAVCDEPGWPDIYTKVFHYVPWILENIRP